MNLDKKQKLQYEPMDVAGDISPEGWREALTKLKPETLKSFDFVVGFALEKTPLQRLELIEKTQGLGQHIVIDDELIIETKLLADVLRMSTINLQNAHRALEMILAKK